MSPRVDHLGVFDAVAHRRQKDRPPSQLVRRGGDMLPNKILSRALAYHPGQIAMGIMVQLAARRTQGLVGNPR